MLQRTLLWQIYDQDQSVVVPESIVKRVKGLYERSVTRSRLHSSENPIVKVLLDVLADVNNNLVLTVLNDIVGEVLPEDESEEEKVERLRRRYNSDDMERRMNNRLTENQ